jgi:hypothetical protein
MKIETKVKRGDYKNYNDDLIQRYWKYQECEFNPLDKYFDQPNLGNHRPPVFHPSESDKNILISPNSQSEENKKVRNLFPHGERHKWYRSMNSSQALAISVLGNLFVHGELSILSRLGDDDGQPLIISQVIEFDQLIMEHKIDYLQEPRKTRIDAFIPGDFQVAIECKFTESEFGSCSRPHLKKTVSNYDKDYCTGAYRQHNGRKEKCPLTKKGISYWDYVPTFFKWDKDEDQVTCHLRYNYQLVRNILAAGIRKNGNPQPENGQVIIIFDERNPACRPGGKIYKSFWETKNALKHPHMLKSVTWQRIINQMRQENILPWLTKSLDQKYGL